MASKLPTFTPQCETNQSPELLFSYRKRKHQRRVPNEHMNDMMSVVIELDSDMRICTEGLTEALSFSIDIIRVYLLTCCMI